MAIVFAWMHGGAGSGQQTPFAPPQGDFVHAPTGGDDGIEPGIADLDNAPKGGMAGSITAALFLRRFVENTPYTHFDIYGWNPTAAPARPKGTSNWPAVLPCHQSGASGTTHS